jgi:dolichol kinase
MLFYLFVFFYLDLNGSDPLILLSGVLAIGIGDSAASVIGSKFGRIRFPFPSSPKTLEGTLASALSQILGSILQNSRFGQKLFG